MARTVNPQLHAVRRDAILEAAQHAILTKGYEQMAIADLVSELHISSGAFYHYFDSKPTLLSALIQRLGDQLEQRVLPIIRDPSLGALDKLIRFFGALDAVKLEHKELVLAYLRVVYADENAIFRHRMYRVRIQRLAPWLEETIAEGTREDVLTTSYPDQAARMIVSLLEDLGYATSDLLLEEAAAPDTLPRLERICTASADALERMLGAPQGAFQRPWSEIIAPWLAGPPEQREERA